MILDQLPSRMFDRDYERGVLLKMMGEHERAHAAFTSAVRRQKRRIARCRENDAYLPYLANILARTYLEMDENLDEALRLAQKATKLKPTEALFFATLSEVHEKMGNRANAIEALKAALQLRPYHEVFKERLAELEEK